MRSPTVPLVRYEHAAPGDLLHLDIKLGRFSVVIVRPNGRRRGKLHRGGLGFDSLASHPPKNNYNKDSASHAGTACGYARRTAAMNRKTRVCGIAFRLGPAAHFGPPPAHAYQQKTPILKELWRLVLKRVANELQKPAKNEESGGEHPQGMIEDSCYAQREREHDQRNSQTMAKPVDRMRVAARVLRDPLFAGASP